MAEQTDAESLRELARVPYLTLSFKARLRAIADRLEVDTHQRADQVEVVAKALYGMFDTDYAADWDYFTDQAEIILDALGTAGRLEPEPETLGWAVVGASGAVYGGRVLRGSMPTLRAEATAMAATYRHRYPENEPRVVQMIEPR